MKANSLKQGMALFQRRYSCFTGNRLRNSGLILLVAAFPILAAEPTGADKAAPIPLVVSVDARIELMSIVFRLAGNPEYRQGKVDRYIKDLDRYFEPVKDHAVVKMARSLRSARGVSFDAPMSLAIHLKDDGSLETRLPLEPRPPNLDNRWEPEEVRAFLVELRNFARESQFEKFFEAEQEHYRKATDRAKQLLDQEGHLEWFGRFFGARAGAEFRLVPALVNGPSNYGPQIKVAGKEELYCILGIYRTDTNGLPVVERAELDTVAHEFCHSYVNPHVYALSKELEPAGQQLFATVKNQMQRMAYGNWQTMLHESIVRASVVRYVDSTQGRAAATLQVLAEQNRGFRWTQELALLLEQYEAQRDKYPDFAAFMPRMVEFFNGYAAKEKGGGMGNESAAPAVKKVTSSTGLIRLSYAIHWPLIQPTNPAPANLRPLLEGNLFGVVASNKLALTLNVTRNPDDRQRSLWNRSLMFPQHGWMSEVQVWDRDETWMWPNLVYLLKLHGRDRTERYGGWDPGKQIDNDFAALLVRTFDAAGKQETAGTKNAPLVSANWHAMGMKNHDRTTIVHEARSDEFVVQLFDQPEQASKGRVKVWFVFGDLMGYPVPKGWPQEPEFNGGILVFFQIDWSYQPGQTVTLSGASPTPDSATGFNWRQWIGREKPDEKAQAPARLKDY